ncbi:ABC transporter permease [bacterium]|nr:ABC transporter permease [bacterium]
MKQVIAIFNREFRSYFASPLALIFICIFLMLTGFFTFKLGMFYEQGQADLRPFFVWHPWLYLFIIPAISMRLWAEEKKTGTIELLLTLPLSLFEAMAGKFLAAWLFIGLALSLTFPIVLTVCYLGNPDLGVIFAAYLGSFLMAGSFLSIGMAVSATTNNQVIAFVVSTVICLLFILFGFEPVVNTLLGFFPAKFVELITNLSFPFHFEAIQRGVLDLRDLVYFLSLMLTALYIGVVALDRGKAE